MDLRKSKVFDNHFDSVEHNEKESDVVVGIDMLLVMVFHPPQGDPMIWMPRYFSTEHHSTKMRHISALQLLEPKTIVYGKIMSVSRPIDARQNFFYINIGYLQVPGAIPAETPRIQIPWIWANRPSNKGSKLLFLVIKAHKIK